MPPRRITDAEACDHNKLVSHYHDAVAELILAGRRREAAQKALAKATAEELAFRDKAEGLAAQLREELARLATETRL